MKEISFDTKFSRPKIRYYSECGTPIIDEYAYKVKDGVTSLEIIGSHDGQAEIDSFAPSCDINVIVARFMAGDDSALNQVSGFYADMKSMPKTYAEWYERYQECENLFNKLPVDIREKFNHSVSEFWSDFGTQHFIDALSIDNVNEEVVKSEVSDAE